MKNFLKYTLATILGIFVTGMILFIIGIVGLTGLLVSSTSSTTKIDDSSIFVLDLQGCITERYQENPFNLLLGETQRPIYGLDDILTSIRKAKENKQIKGIFLNAGLLDCAPASLQAIRNALADFKQSKKFIVAYSGAYTQGCYYIASIADKLIVNPTGSISWHGLSAQTIFLKDLLAKVGIEMQVFRVGTYKSAVEPYTETTMSVANREQTMDFLQSIWKQIKEEVAQSRTISTDSLNMLADWNMDMQPAETYLSTGLADTLMYQDEVLSYLKNLTNKKESDELVTLTIEDMINLPDNKTSQALNTIAVYYAFGEIGSEDLYEENINAEKVTTDLRKLREDKNVKAVVLRINSPGGSAYDSEQIWREITRLKEEKPVVVSMGDYAASGGYYISSAADWIVAEPTTLTGSIGIFGLIPNTQKLTEEKLGLHFDVVKTNPLADAISIFRPCTEVEKHQMQVMINNGYELFVKRCADGRNMSVEDIKKIAEGRIWTGKTAKELNLIDDLGGIYTAIEKAATLANLEDYTVSNLPEKENLFSSLLNTPAERYIHTRLYKEFGIYSDCFSILQHIEKADILQARMPYTVNIN